MSSFDWQGIVRTVAPALATALGGPLAGMAAQAISTAVLGRPDGSEEEIAEAIQVGGMDALVAIKKAGNDFAIRLKELDIEAARLNNQDRANARDREAKTGDTATPRNLAYMLTLGFFSFLFAVLFIGVPESARDTVNIMLGSLGTAWVGAMVYYHGSTNGSNRKTELLAKAEAIRGGGFEA